MEETLHWLAFGLLSPIFGLQALWLRRTVPKLPEPPCPRQGQSGQGRRLRILILGDSAGAGVGAGLQAKGLAGQLVSDLDDSYEVHWTVHAKTGWTTRDCLDHLHLLPAQEFDAVVTSLGVNDVTGMVSTPTWIAQQECLMWRLRDRFASPLLFVSGVPPIRQFPRLPNPLRWWLDKRASRLSSTLKNRCQSQSDCAFIEIDTPFTADMMAPDGFHPGPPVYKIWGGLVADAIRARYPLSK